MPRAECGEQEQRKVIAKGYGVSFVGDKQFLNLDCDRCILLHGKNIDF